MKLIDGFKDFWTTFRKSLFVPLAYKRFVSASFKKSLSFFLLLILLLTVLNLANFALNTIPGFNQVRAFLGGPAFELYPKDLVLNIKSGRAQTNVAEPFFIPLSDQEVATSSYSPSQVYLLVIDTAAPIDAIKQYRTAALLTAEEIVILDRDSVRAIPLKNVGDLTLTSAVYDQLLAQVNQALRWVLPVGLVVSGLMIFGGLLLSRALFIIVASPVLWLADKLLKTRLGYRKLLQLGAHAIVLPSLVGLITTITGIRVPIPLFLTLIYLAFTIFVLVKIKKSSR